MPLWRGFLSPRKDILLNARFQYKHIHEFSNTLSPPPGFSLFYKPGTRFFIMERDIPIPEDSSGTSNPPKGRMVIVRCSIPHQRYSFRTTQLKSKRGELRSRSDEHTQTPFISFSPATAFPIRTRPIFSAFITGKTSGLTMEVSCTSLAGFLSLKRIVFHKGVLRDDIVSEKTLNDPRLHYYQGPLLNQNNLAECVLNSRDRLSFLDAPRYLPNMWFNKFVNPKFSEEMFYGHLPVHTIRPEFFHSITEWLNTLGIDDDLADFVQKYAFWVQEEEEKRWLSLIEPILQRG